MQTKRLVAVAKVDARRGADALLEILQSEGVQYIFGNPGTTELPVAMPLHFDSSDIGRAEMTQAFREGTDLSHFCGFQTSKSWWVWNSGTSQPGQINFESASSLVHDLDKLEDALMRNEVTTTHGHKLRSAL